MNRVEMIRSVVGAVGGYLAKAGLSVAIDPTNLDLDTALDSALRRAGIEPAVQDAPDDADFARIRPGAVLYAKALANAESLHLARGNLARVDQALGPSNQKLSQYAAQAAELAAFWEARAEALAPSGSTDAAGSAGAASGVMAPYIDPGAGGIPRRTAPPPSVWGIP